jgi:Protein of unknown function (DUF2934)
MGCFLSSASQRIPCTPRFIPGLNSIKPLNGNSICKILLALHNFSIVRCTILWHGALTVEKSSTGGFMPLAMNNAFANRDQLIADIAYKLWEEEGRPQGKAEDHWLRAAVLIDEKKPAAKKTASRKVKAKA